MLKLLLTRGTITEDGTEGTLIVDGAPRSDTSFLLYTLEYPVIDGRPGTAILKGIYPVVFAPSAKFLAKEDDLWIRKYARLIPHIQVPNRPNVLLQFGSYWLDDEDDGCVLVGTSREPGFLGYSRQAFEQLWRLIEIPAQNGSCEIEVIGSAI
jgi:Family of unknown function (DUF5675)